MTPKENWMCAEAYGANHRMLSGQSRRPAQKGSISGFLLSAHEAVTDGSSPNWRFDVLYLGLDPEYPKVELRVTAVQLGCAEQGVMAAARSAVLLSSSPSSMNRVSAAQRERV